MRRYAAVVLSLAVVLAACGGDDDDDDTTTDTTGASADATTAPGDSTEEAPDETSGGDTGEVPRPATVSWDGGEVTVALAMCDAVGDDLLVSGTSDDDQLLIIEINGGTGDVYVSDTASLEDVMAGTVDSYDIDGEGAFTASGSVTTGGSGTFELTGDCDAPAG